jgi:hypothetical protein
MHAVCQNLLAVNRDTYNVTHKDDEHHSNGLRLYEKLFLAFAIVAGILCVLLLVAFMRAA